MFRLIMSVLCLFMWLPKTVRAENIALVIGNGSYDNITSLRSPKQDAEAYRELLQTLGYSVQLAVDVDKATFYQTLDHFHRQIEEGDRVVVVYSGHGWSDGTRNYLIPVDAAARGSQNFLASESIRVDEAVLRPIESAKAKLTFAVIDACRNNPFDLPDTDRSGLPTRGLKLSRGGDGSVVVYSARQGQTALDYLPGEAPNDGELSVFARFLIPALEEEISLQDTFEEAQVQTTRLAKSVEHDQVPAIRIAYAGGACLTAACEVREDITYLQCGRQLEAALSELTDWCSLDWEPYLESCG
ncbi:MAG: hypothetical protein CSA72_02730 [Rhodobacterales bacterium]|nr:MAG: hypothetical protein CSA72_02730 [Rhodobacterales bacterium]